MVKVADIGNPVAIANEALSTLARCEGQQDRTPSSR